MALPANSPRRVPTTLKQLIEQTPAIPSMSTAVLEVLRLAGDPDSSASHLADAISVDAALAARVLRLANSAYYGLPREVATVQDAVTLLGRATVRSVAMLAASYPWFDAEDEATAECNLWEHAVGVAAGAEVIVRRIDRRLADEAFCAGLLHNIGMSVIVRWAADKVPTLIQFSVQKKLSFHETEKLVFGYNHMEVGSALGADWNLPPRLLDCIAMHHEPSKLARTSLLVDAVHVADYLCKALGIGLGAENFTIQVDTSSMDRLGLTNPNDLTRVQADLLSRFRSASELLELS
ncbi:MAG: HDOD domain-containing protein [Armatimonadetes bacterium]|nr:HDOD domain-containing protein [Armatimonadota bacterium]NOG93492.1 HDOD domain-containing protein [Armatimonadota bacterium]